MNLHELQSQIESEAVAELDRKFPSLNSQHRELLKPFLTSTLHQATQRVAEDNKAVVDAEFEELLNWFHPDDKADRIKSAWKKITHQIL